MCDPVSALIVGAGTAMSAYGSYKASKAKSQELQSQARVFSIQSDIAKSNIKFLNTEAEILETSESLAFAKAAQGESRIRKTQDLMEGANRADAAARNLDPTTGSPVLIQMRNAMQFQSDIDTLRAHGQMEAGDILTRAANLRQQAVGEQGRAFTASVSGDSSLTASANVQTAGLITAGTELLSGALKIYQPGLYAGKK